jgi:hypothetical protein
MVKIPKNIERKMPDDHDSGTITLEGSTVLWHNNDLVFSKIDLNDIIVIGEYTNSNGPWFEDWFITFVKKDGKWSSIPWYANNIEALLEELSNRFNPDLKNSQLANSTSWKSIIRHPKVLEGIELFNKIPGKNYNPPKTLFQKLLKSLGFGNFNLDQELALSKPALQAIEKL